MTLLCAAGSGGHLAQLYALRKRFEPQTDALWLTDRTPQSESLLAKEEVVFLPHSRPRDVLGVVKNGFRVAELVRERGVRAAVSTGAGIALSVLPVVAARGGSATYIESATRVNGPSLTGRVISRFPRIRCLSQYPNWGPPWEYRGNVLEGYAVSAEERLHNSSLRVVVSLGANQHAGFRPAIEKLAALIPKEWSVVWQTGPTDVDGLGIAAVPYMKYDELQNAIALSDVLVTHAGTGSVLSGLMSGKVPLLIPRRAKHGEHVDDHQLELARKLEELGLAVVREVGEVQLDDLWMSASRSICEVHLGNPIPIGVKGCP